MRLFNRRVLLDALGKIGSGTFLLQFIPLRVLRQQQRAARYRNLDEQQARLLLAIAEVIIPAREGHPTVRQLDVIGYMDREITSHDEWTAIRSGLQRFGRGFEKPDERKAFFRSVWNGGGAQSDFLHRVRRYVVDAYYSDPSVWKAIGFNGRAQFVGHPDFHDPRQMKH